MYDDLFLFTRVAHFDSLTRAARELNIYQSTLSRRIATLEKKLGVKLFLRTTTHFELTTQGKMLYERIRNDERLVQQHIVSAINNQNLIFGELHVMLPQVLSLTKITPFIPEFIKNHPHLQLKISYQNHEVNLKEGGIDIAITGGKPRQPSQKIKLVHRAKLVAFCSPKYIAQYGDPDINDTSNLRAIAVLRDHGEVIDHVSLRNIHNNNLFKLHVNYQLATNNFLHNLLLVNSGEYVAVTYLETLQEYLSKENYVTIFSDYEFEPLDFYILKRVDDDPRINIVAKFIEQCFTQK